jgi:hypothetical protein
LEVTVTVIVPVRLATAEYKSTVPAVAILPLSEALPLEFKVRGVAPVKSPGVTFAANVPFGLPTAPKSAAGAGGPKMAALSEWAELPGACAKKGFTLKRFRVSNGSRDNFRFLTPRFFEYVRSDSIKDDSLGMVIGQWLQCHSVPSLLALCAGRRCSAGVVG